MQATISCFSSSGSRCFLLLYPQQCHLEMADSRVSAIVQVPLAWCPRFCSPLLLASHLPPTRNIHTAQLASISISLPPLRLCSISLPNSPSDSCIMHMSHSHICPGIHTLLRWVRASRASSPSRHPLTPTTRTCCSSSQLASTTNPASPCRLHLTSLHVKCLTYLATSTLLAGGRGQAGLLCHRITS